MVLEFYSQDSYGAYVKSEMAGTLRNAGGGLRKRIRNIDSTDGSSENK